MASNTNNRHTEIDDDEDVSYEEVEVTDEEEEEEEEEHKTTEEDEGTRVEWPPEENEKAGGEKKENGIANASEQAKRTKKDFNVADDDSALSATIGRDVFRPGKLENRWQAPHAITETQKQAGVKTSSEKPNFKLRKVEDFLPAQTVKHASYHVPPGTSRTRKAQENYTKHLVQEET